jgi:hypothetical protein
MKTVQKGEEIKRLKDEDAEFHVKSKGYKYVPKSVYKEATRPAKKEEKNSEETETKAVKKNKKDN